MKNKQKILQLGIALALLLAPGAVFAQADLGIDAQSVVFSDEITGVQAGETLKIDAVVENQGDELVIGDIELVVDTEKVAEQGVQLAAGERYLVSFIWDAPLEAGKHEVLLRLANQDPVDENELNDELELGIVTVVAGGETVEEVAPNEEDQVIEEESEEEVGTVNLQDAEIPPFIIRAEQLNWNTFRFRPSFRLGLNQYEYQWEFEDGTVEQKLEVEKSFPKPGTYNVTLTVTQPEGDEAPQVSTMQVHVGFFHLANWRLWILIVLLGTIIVIGAIVAGVTDKVVGDREDLPKMAKPQMPRTGEDEETVFNTLSEDTGDLDAMAETGLDSKDLSDELALLESLDKTPTAVGEEEIAPIEEMGTSPMEEVETEAVAKIEEASVVSDEKPKKAVAKKKTTKRVTRKKNTTPKGAAKGAAKKTVKKSTKKS